MRRTIANIFWLGTKELRAFSHDFVLRRPGDLGVFALDRQHRAGAAFRNCTTPRSASSTRINRRCRGGSPARSCRPTSRRRGRSPRATSTALMNTGAAHLRHRHPAQLPARRAGRTRGPAPGQRRRDRHDAGGHRRRLRPADHQLPRSTAFVSRSEVVPRPPVNLDVRIAFNPNLTTAWFTSVMGDHQQRDDAGDHSGRRGYRPRARARHDGPSAGHAVDAVRNRDVENLVERLGDHRRGRPLAGCRRPRPARRSDRRLDPAVPGRRRDLSVLRHGNRHLSRHRRALDAAARPAVHAGRDSR